MPKPLVIPKWAGRPLGRMCTACKRHVKTGFRVLTSARQVSKQPVVVSLRGTT